MIDERIDERLRKVSKAVVAMTPEPPRFPERSPGRGPVRFLRPAVVGFALALVLGLATVLVLAVRSDSDPMAGEQATSPLPSVALGDGFVWPSEPLGGTPESIALAFAAEALAWEDATAAADGVFDQPAPTWLTIESADAGASVRLLVSPTGIGGGWAIYQIGMPPAIRTIEVGRPGSGAAIQVEPPEAAAQAVLTLRLSDGETREVVVGLESLDRSRIEFEDIDPESVYTVLVRYVDSGGSATGADGGWSRSSVDPIVIGVDPLIELAQYGAAAVPDRAPQIPEATGLTPLGSLDDIGDVLFLGGGYNQPDLAAAGFTDMVAGQLELNPLAGPSEPVVVLGAVDSQLVVEWRSGDGAGSTCVAVFEGNSAATSCSIPSDGPVSLWRFDGDTVRFAGTVIDGTGWVELLRNGDLVAWQVPRAGAVSMAVSAEDGDVLTSRMFDRTGALLREDGMVPSSQSDVVVTDDELALAITHWPNLTGLGQTDPEVWLARLDRSCSEGAWDHDVARALAEEFIEKDMPLSLRADGSRPATADGAQALWLMTRNVCGEAFPPGVIEQGPPIAGG